MKNCNHLLLTALLLGLGFQLTTAQQPQNKLTYSLDSVMAFYLAQEDYLSGGVVSVVLGDSVFYQKAFGMADMENNLAFDAQHTTLEIASVTKLITTTALLQLVEKGKVSLNSPVNQYFKNPPIQNPFEKPVLVKHLLTHTAGFDDRQTLMESPDPASIIPLAEYNQKYLPQIVWEPGRFFNYSNYSFNLMAYLVEEVSGLPFEEYVRVHILEPLEMTNSGVGYQRQFEKNLMRRCKLKRNDKEEVFSKLFPPHYTNLPGATAFKTTGSDMTNFILMYLNEGRFKGRQILKKETVELAFQTHFTYHPRMPYQQGLGWRIKLKNNISLLYHYGDDDGVEASLVLIPEKKIGLFTTFNNQMGYDAKIALENALLKICCPPGDTLVPTYQHHTSPEKISGRYLYMNDGQSTFEKIAYLFGDKALEVKILEKDTVQVNQYKYLETEPLLFDMIGNNGKLKFIKNDRGEVEYLSFGTSTYRRATNWSDPVLHRIILLCCFFVLLGSILIFLVQFLRRIRNPNIWRDNLWAYRIIGLNILTLLLFFVCLIIAVNTITSLNGPVPLLIKMAALFPMAALLLLPFSLYALWATWQNRHVHRITALWMSVCSIAIGLCLIVLNSYNFVGFHFY